MHARERDEQEEGEDAGSQAVRDEDQDVPDGVEEPTDDESGTEAGVPRDLQRCEHPVTLARVDEFGRVRLPSRPVEAERETGSGRDNESQPSRRVVSGERLLPR